MQGGIKVENFNYNKHLPQTSADKTSDLFFILSCLYLAERDQKQLTQLTLEKSLFKTTQSLASKNTLFLNTFFYINKLGPHNNIFYKYLGELEEASLIKKESMSITLTARGSSVMSELLENVSEDPEILRVLVDLQSKINYCVSHPGISVDETHKLEVIDTTDNNKKKTVEQLIKEIKPEYQFEKASQFKYLNPFSKNPTRVEPPATTLNELENILAKVDKIDFSQEMPLETLFV